MYVVRSECFQVIMSVTNISVSYGRYFFKTTVQSMKEIMSDLKPDDLTT
eukprot:COSAG01_NODE_49753_length_369_cov_0.948148_1_plen_48_part_01